MSADRKKKLKKVREKDVKQKARKAEAEEDRRASLRRVLKVLGIDIVFDKLPAEFFESFLLRVRPEVEVVVAEELRHDPIARDAERRIKALVKEPRKGVRDGREYELAFEDFYRSYLPTVWAVDYYTDLLRRHRKPSMRAKGRLLEEAKPIMEQRDAWLGMVIGAVSRPILDVSDDTYRLDQNALEVRLTRSADDGTPFHHVLGLSVHRPAPLQVTYRGLEGTAYLCKTQSWLDGFAPCRWNCKKLGIDGPDRDLPVYVSKHAIARLHERLPMFQTRSWMHLVASDSLAAPVIVPQGADRNLVEVRIGHGRLGYFVFETLPNMILIKTFLFLTMQGTPEAARLKSKLGLHRADVEHYKLDHLFTLVYSDIVKDQLLCKILEECGCGHMLTLVDLENRLRWVDRFGGKLRAKFDIREAREGFKVGSKFMRWGNPTPAAE